MHFSEPRADVFVPGSQPDARAALAAVTHLCVGAHQDDIEIMAYAGICDCLDQAGKSFGGVVATNGAGSPRTGPYASYTDEQMRNARRDEQRRAAMLGRYGIQIQLAHPSSNVKTPRHPAVLRDLTQIFELCRPETLYLHNPADKHDTHIAILARCIEALRDLPPSRRPGRVLGCEVWRDLDWLPDADKVALDAGRHSDLALSLLAVFDSQVAGGKRYDLASIGRRAANATFHTSHATDKLTGITWAVDLTPVVSDPKLSLEAFTAGLIEKLKADVAERIRKFCG